MAWAFILRATGLAKRLWAIARAYPMQAALIGLVCLSVWLWQGKRDANDRADRVTALNAANVASHRTTKRNYAQAMADARRNEALRLARVKAEQERINDDRKAAANARLDALRARYDSLRNEVRTGTARAAGGKPVPSLPAPATGADAAPGADGLSAAELTLAERYQCSVGLTQLDELITWVEAQVRINPNH